MSWNLSFGIEQTTTLFNENWNIFTLPSSLILTLHVSKLIIFEGHFYIKMNYLEAKSLKFQNPILFWLKIQSSQPQPGSLNVNKFLIFLDIVLFCWGNYSQHSLYWTLNGLTNEFEIVKVRSFRIKLVFSQGYVLRFMTVRLHKGVKGVNGW